MPYFRRQGCTSKSSLLVLLKRQSLHAVALLIDQLEAIEHGKSPLDDLAYNIAFMRDTDVVQCFTAHHAVMFSISLPPNSRAGNVTL